MNKTKFNVFCADYVRSLLAEPLEREETSAGSTGQQLGKSHVEAGNRKSPILVLSKQEIVSLPLWFCQSRKS